MAVTSPDTTIGTPTDATTGTEPGGQWAFLKTAKAVHRGVRQIPQRVRDSLDPPDLVGKTKSERRDYRVQQEQDRIHSEITSQSESDEKMAQEMAARTDIADRINGVLGEVTTAESLNNKLYDLGYIQGLIDKGALTMSEIGLIKSEHLHIQDPNSDPRERRQRVLSLSNKIAKRQQTPEGQKEETERKTKAEQELVRQKEAAERQAKSEAEAAAAASRKGIGETIREKADSTLQSAVEKLSDDKEMQKVLRKALPIIVGLTIAAVGVAGAHKMGYTKSGAEVAAKAFRLGKDLPIKDLLSRLRKLHKKGSETISAEVAESGEISTEPVESLTEVGQKLVETLIEAAEKPEKRQRLLSTIGSSAVLEGLGISQGWNFLKNMVGNAVEEETT